AEKGIDLRCVAKQIRLPLVGIASHEAIEVFKAHPGRPQVEGSDLAGFESGSVVIFAKPTRRVTIVPQDSADGCLVFRDDAVVPGKSGGLLRNDSKTGRVVIATSDEGGARRRTEGGRVDLSVSQAGLGNSIHRRRWNDAAKRARHS